MAEAFARLRGFGKLLAKADRNGSSFPMERDASSERTRSVVVGPHLRPQRNAQLLGPAGPPNRSAPTCAWDRHHFRQLRERRRGDWELFSARVRRRSLKRDASCCCLPGEDHGNCPLSVRVDPRSLRGSKLSDCFEQHHGENNDDGAEQYCCDSLHSATPT